MNAYVLARPRRLSVTTLARRTGLHPELIRRFVALSLLDASRDATGQLWFAATAPVTVARIQRLHAGLSLNYNAIGLVLDLLDRIETLEAELRASRARQTTGG
jgi:chaperone modulatory protein CbpM